MLLAPEVGGRVSAQDGRVGEITKLGRFETRCGDGCGGSSCVDVTVRLDDGDVIESDSDDLSHAD